MKKLVIAGLTILLVGCVDAPEPWKPDGKTDAATDFRSGSADGKGEVGVGEVGAPDMASDMKVVDIIEAVDAVTPVDIEVVLPDVTPDVTEDINGAEVCQPDCTDKECGGDGCGGSCGECEPSLVCKYANCIPVPGCGALSFDGIDDWIEIPHSKALDLESEITVEVKFVAEMTGTSRFLVRKGAGVANYLMTLSADMTLAAGAFVAGAAEQAYIASGSEPLEEGKWHHATMTLTSEKTTLYLDGTPYADATLVGDFKPNTQPLTIGYGYPAIWQDSFFAGSMSMVRVWNKALSPEEVGAKLDEALVPTEEKGLVGIWRFAEGEGTVAHGQADNLDGAINGATWEGTPWGEECCTPNCDGKECGDDGCGGSCGECAPFSYCVQGGCLPTGSKHFSGTHSYLPSQGILGPKTYSFWFRVDDVSQGQVLIIKKDSLGQVPDTLPISMGISGGHLHANVIWEGGPGTTTVATTPVESDTWYYVTWQISEAKAELYLHGKLVGQMVLPGKSIDNDSDYAVGAAPSVNMWTSKLTGDMYNLRIEPGFLYESSFIPCEVDSVGPDSMLISFPGPVPCSCEPQCEGKQCGEDGCGGSCGECGPEQECTGTGQCIDGQTLGIPAGPFWMGCNETLDEHCLAAEYPYHEVTTAAYDIDLAEVTNQDFATFLNSHGEDCSGQACFVADNPDVQVKKVGDSWTADAGKENHPIGKATWFGANEYCSWAGRRLCTEAEWEKAARGGCELYSDCQAESIIYPWGGISASCSEGNFFGCGGEPVAVGSYDLGASPYGVMDMAGNVFEWTADCWHETYDGAPTNGEEWSDNCLADRVMRGSSFFTLDYSVSRTSYRGHGTPSYGTENFVGFRCCHSTCAPACEDGEMCVDGECVSP